MSLFDADEQLAGVPLATRMRPLRLEDLVGQARLLGPGSPLRRAIDAGRPHSMILHGPPGSGKTTLARIVAGAAGAAIEEHSAVAAGRAEVRAVIERARHRQSRTVFFLDEIHRFNKAQQDALLPAVEDGVLTLIGATTENPRFEVNAALLSRVRVYELEPLAGAEVLELLRRARARGECAPAVVSDEALELVAARAGGDARVALGALELACATSGTVGVAEVDAALDRGTLRYDRAGGQHYDTISAWIKATRGSDPDASLYYLAVMLESGEDPRFIVRRMIILASEDIGNADPQALVIAAAAAAAVEHVGLPECSFALAQTAIYLALAPKSNVAGVSLGAARAHVREHGAATIPPHLRSGGGSLYDYPHDHPGHLSRQELMPDAVAGTRFFDPDGAEPGLIAALARVRAGRGRGG